MGIRDPKRNWFLTYPRNDATPEKLLSELSDIAPLAEYLIAQEEHKDGGHHLHAYIKFQGTGVKLSDAPDTFSVLDVSGNYQPCRSCKDVIKYCSKDESYISNFDVKKYMDKKGKLTVSTIKAKSAKQALEDGDITIHAIRNYNLARSILVDPYEHDSVRGLWVYGPPGTGKSTAVRDSFPGYFDKSQNKWFDGYQGEKTIFIDDFDDKKSFLGHYLKRWTDKFACQGEIKGGMVHLQHTTFAVTSNYSIEELFEDPILQEALNRRFRVVHKTSLKVGLFDPKPVEKHYLGGLPLGPEEERVSDRGSELFDLYAKMKQRNDAKPKRSGLPPRPYTPLQGEAKETFWKNLN